MYVYSNYSISVDICNYIIYHNIDLYKCIQYTSSCLVDMSFYVLNH